MSSSTSSPACVALNGEAETEFRTALKQLEEAIDLIEPAEKEAYTKAKELVPHLVERESNPIHFLQREQFDTWAAAKRLTTYWKERAKHFRNRAFRPLTIADDQGALSQNDIDMIDSKMIVQLPNDQHGRTVLFFDRSKLDPNKKPETSSRIRCFFYHALQVTENPNSIQGEGIVAVGLMVRTPHGFDWEYPSTLSYLVREALPIRVYKIHVVSLPKATGVGSFLENTVSITLKMLASFIGNVEVHHGREESELVEQLKKIGLSRKDIPEILGGGWKPDKFATWKRRQVRLEVDTYMSMEKKLERKRRINMVHSRQKRMRRKIEQDVMQEQVDNLVKQKQGLEAEGRRLEQLLVDARREITRAHGIGGFGTASLQSAPMVTQSSMGFASFPAPLYHIPEGRAGRDVSNAALAEGKIQNFENLRQREQDDNILLQNILFGRLVAERERVMALQAQLQLHRQTHPGLAQPEPLPVKSGASASIPQTMNMVSQQSRSDPLAQTPASSFLGWLSGLGGNG